MRQHKKMGRRGSNQIKEILFSVDEGSLDYWANRLDEKGIAAERPEELGTKRLKFAHPCGIPYTLVGTSGDTRRGFGGGGVEAEHGIKGAYAPLISVIDAEEMVLYLETGIGAKKVAEDGEHQAWDLEGEKFGSQMELLHEPDVRPGTWHFAEGTPHHWQASPRRSARCRARVGLVEQLDPAAELLALEVRPEASPSSATFLARIPGRAPSPSRRSPRSAARRRP